MIYKRSLYVNKERNNFIKANFDFYTPKSMRYKKVEVMKIINNVFYSIVHMWMIKLYVKTLPHFNDKELSNSK